MKSFRSCVVMLLVLGAAVAAKAADEPGEAAKTFGEWVYPDSSRLQEDRPAGESPVTGTGQYTTKDSVQKVAHFYARKAGLDLDSKSLDFDLPSYAGIVAVRARDDAPSAMFLRNAGESTVSATLLYLTPGDTQKLAVSITRGRDDERTLVQLLLHQRN